MDIKFTDLSYTVQDAIFKKSEFDLQNDRKSHWLGENNTMDSVTDKPVFFLYQLLCSGFLKYFLFRFT